MTDKQITTGTRTNGRFAKGHSGNPSGRPPMLAPELRIRLDKASPEILDKVVEKALEGDMAAAKIVLDRAAPLSKSTAPPIIIPNLASAETLSEKAGAVINAVANGECPADIGAMLIQSIGALSRIIEIDELDRRLSALEGSV